MESSAITTHSAMSRPEVLIVDDQHRSFQALLRSISPEAFSVSWAVDAHQGLELLRSNPARQWIVIVDLNSSGMGGAGFLHKARHVAPRATIMVTAPLGPFLYQDGSFYELSGLSLKHEINGILLGIVHRSGVAAAGQAEAELEVAPRESFGPIIGRSRSINEIYRLIQHLKDSLATVLIQGESGTGKELIARTIHQNSQRSNKVFLAINCGAIPATLIESELFGHERGAFTGAVCQKKGKFEAAHGGTLFLDEIGELDKDLQVKLLRVLQEKEFQRVGGNANLKTDVRILAATSRDLKAALQQGEFREDLYYRLNVVPIEAPPLRDRSEDVPLLLDHFFQNIAGAMQRPVPQLTEEARRALIHYSYPGNVRELANLVERLLVTCRNGKIGRQELPLEIRAEAGQGSSSTECLREFPDGGYPLKEVERELILKTLEKTSGNKLAAAKMLGITRRLLYLRLTEYQLSEQHGCHGK